ncbi:hypothetical protein L873DRAFT_1677853 [Choiromyces venosus 120613-1]|uniref:Aminoglycoside phosphotransferase domain-containing protein n=1 Tax=Choiromyces venosus 120613-1 TaxID=1336337 RepID=A0A3N4JVP2_9PEZI|nr:hypothetical protein L873DRAFT_1677853 [Choiromyces venosus 120613-1]
MAEDGRFYRLKSQDKMKVIRELALVQAELSKPSEFTKIGSIYHRGKDKSEFYVGELISAACGEDFPEEDEEAVPSKGPYSSLPELWQARLERETLLAIRNWSSSTSEPSKTSLSSPSKANPQQFGEVLQLLSGLTSLFTPPQELSTLCIHHSDLAIRNVLFDEKTLKITGVIDWEFAAVVPLVITGRFPNDLGWEGNEFARSLGKLGNAAEQWNHHYYDWTSLEGVTPPPAPNGTTPESSLSTTPCPSSDYLSAPNTSPPTPPSSDEKCLPCSNQHSGEETPIPTTPTPQQTSKIPSPPSPPLPPPPTSQTPQKDLDIRAARLVQLFYLRKYYASCVASRDFTLTRLFIDSIAYVKFNEIVMGGHDKWFSAIEWIREVFWRLKTLGEDEVELGERLRGGRAVVKVPEVFAGRADRGVVDLGGWEDRLRRKGVGAAPIVERSL